MTHNDGLVSSMYCNWPKEIVLFISLTLMLFSHKIRANYLYLKSFFSAFKCQVIKFLFYFSVEQVDFPLCKNVTEQLWPYVWIWLPQRSVKASENAILWWNELLLSHQSYVYNDWHRCRLLNITNKITIYYNILHYQ